MAWWGTSTVTFEQDTSGALTFSGEIASPVGASLPTQTTTGLIVVIPGQGSGGSFSFSSAPTPLWENTGEQRVVLAQVTDVPSGDTPLPPTCPIWSPHDYLQLVRFRQDAELAGVGGTNIVINQPPGDTMPPAFVIGQPLEAVDYFRFRAYGSGTAVTVTFFGRIMHMDGSIVPFAYPLTTDTAGTVFTTTQGTGPGWLIDAAASVPPNSISFGNASAIAEIGRVAGADFTPHTLLFNGQLDGLNPLTTVNPPTNTPLSRIDNLIFNDVPGGTTTYAHVVTPNAGKRMRFTRIAWVWTSSATVGTRFPTVALRSNGNSFWQGESTLTRTAGQAGAYNFNLEVTPATSGTQYLGTLPATMYFYQPISVEILDGSTAVPSGDAITSVFIRWEES